MSKLYCASGWHHPYYCLCPATCALCGISTNHSTAQHEQAACVMCHACDEVEVHDEDTLCSECVSEQAQHFVPDEERDERV